MWLKIISYKAVNDVYKSYVYLDFFMNQIKILRISHKSKLYTYMYNLPLTISWETTKKSPSKEISYNDKLVYAKQNYLICLLVQWIQRNRQEN